MLILAFETSAKAASAALLEDGKLLGESYQNTGLTHSQTLMVMAENLLSQCGKTVEDVTAVAVAAGPGSFTGIRIGVSTVKGLAWAGDKPCVGVSTLEAMAWHGLAAGGYVCPVMDARRSQVYNALFEIKDGRPQRLCDDRAIALSELACEIRGKNAFLVGDGAELTYEYMKNEGIDCRIAPPNLLYQSAWGVGMAAQGKTPGTADDLLPVYLRLSQAERERQERMNMNK